MLKLETAISRNALDRIIIFTGLRGEVTKTLCKEISSAGFAKKIPADPQLCGSLLCTKTTRETPGL